jgi:hypothetical protein
MKLRQLVETVVALERAIESNSSLTPRGVIGKNDLFI